MAEAAAAPVKRKKVTIPMLMEKKKKSEPIVQLAVYDYENAIVADRSASTSCASSDTGGMVLFGHEIDDVGDVRGGDVHGAGGQARLAVRPAHGRHALHELPPVAAAGGRQRREVRSRRPAPR